MAKVILSSLDMNEAAYRQWIAWVRERLAQAAGIAGDLEIVALPHGEHGSRIEAEDEERHALRLALMALRDELFPVTDALEREWRRWVPVRKQKPRRARWTPDWISGPWEAPGVVVAVPGNANDAVARSVRNLWEHLHWLEESQRILPIDEPPLCMGECGNTCADCTLPFPF